MCGVFRPERADAELLETQDFLCATNEVLVMLTLLICC